MYVCDQVVGFWSGKAHLLKMNEWPGIESKSKVSEFRKRKIPNSWGGAEGNISKLLILTKDGSPCRLDVVAREHY